MHKTDIGSAALCCVPNVQYLATIAEYKYIGQGWNKGILDSHEHEYCLIWSDNSVLLLQSLGLCLTQALEPNDQNLDENSLSPSDCFLLSGNIVKNELAL